MMLSSSHRTTSKILQRGTVFTRHISSSSTASLYKPQPVSPAAATGSQQDSRRVRLLFFGKPGAGKGTLSARLVKKYDVASLSAGDLLRAQITNKTAVGIKAKAIMDKGELVSDGVMISVVTSALEGYRQKNWLLDGFPRTLEQGKLLNRHLSTNGTPLTAIINLDVPDDVILDRIGDRWLHVPSGRVYNTRYSPPKVRGRDDITGEALVQRPDDNPQIFARRLKTYYDQTAPLLDYYASLVPSSGSDGFQLFSFKGNTSDELWPQIEAVLQRDLGLKPRAGTRSSLREPGLQMFGNVSQSSSSVEASK